MSKVDSNFIIVLHSSTFISKTLTTKTHKVKICEAASAIHSKKETLYYKAIS